MPHDDYVQHLLNDLQADAHYAQGREIGTIFIGGGTPSLLSGPAMQTLLDGVRACLPLAAGAEITMEANLGTVEADRFVDYQRAGVNRISIGVQSFSEPKLQRLGRIHGPEEAKRAARLASGLGFAQLQPRPDARPAGPVAGGGAGRSASGDCPQPAAPVVVLS